MNKTEKKPRELLRRGLIGCGDIARRRVAPALASADRSPLHAVARARVDLAAGFAREFGAQRWYADWRELVADPEVDAVYIATPVALHAAQALAAARNGKHVLCEKPMACSLKDSRAMVDACRKAGVRLGIADYRHYYPVIVRIKEILSSGELGAPVIAELDAFSFYDPAPDHPRRWLVEKRLSGGGPLKDFGRHGI